ncbi:MAG: hypothetical protein Q9209_007661 [Squamulea sp. 1 TL-2023]
MLGPPLSDDPESIYIIFTGFNSHLENIVKAYKHEKHAIRWCKRELRLLNGKAGSDTESKGNDWEVSKWIDGDKPGKKTRVGYTIKEKILAPSESTDSSKVHIVCNIQSLEVSYVSTDPDKAAEVCNQDTSSVVRIVDYAREHYQAIEQMFTLGGKPIPSSVAGDSKEG